MAETTTNREAGAGATRTAAVLRAAVPPARRLLPAIAAGVGSAGAQIALLATSAWLIARAAEQPPVLFLSFGIVGVRAFALARAVFRYLERLAGHDAAFRQLAAIRSGVFERMLPVAPDGIVATLDGDLLARFTADVDELQNVSLRVVQPVVSAMIVLAAALVGLGALAPVSAVAVAACVLAAAGIAVAAEVAAWRSDRRMAPLRGQLQAAVVEHVRGADVLVAYGADAASRLRIDALAAEATRAGRRRTAAAGAAAAAMTAVGGIAAVTSLLLARAPLASGRIDGPVFALVCLVPLAIAEVAAAIPPAVGAWRLARSSAERVADAVPDEVPPEIPPQIPAVAAPSASGRLAPHRSSGTADSGRAAPPVVSLRGVTAVWPTADGTAPPVAPAPLRDLDLELAPGERLLVRGESGAGKTTLAHVLVRFLEYGGSYRIDGVEARALDPGEVRRRIGLVEQRPWLFDESIRQNLIFARDTASDAELEAVLTRVGLAEWAEARGGLDAPVGERGALVSGGQAQRLALARAMLAEFPVLVLDEPTANVDAGRAAAVLRELLDAASGRSVVVISHAEVDPGLVDRTLVLADGRLSRAGSAA